VKIIVKNFIEKPINAQALSNRKLVYGAGTNDAPYATQPMLSGTRVKCPYYTVWDNMLKRVYYAKFIIRQPCYVGTSIHKPWLSFMAFRAWMETQQWQNKVLDKDLIDPGNKHYSPLNCCFIEQSLNNLMTINKRTKGKYPAGVTWNNNNKQFVARLSIDTKRVYLGDFVTEQLASNAYLEAKANHIIDIAYQQQDVRLKAGLLLHATKLMGEIV